MPQFRPGMSGNPGGRPSGRSEARQIAREHAGAAVFALVRICCDGRASIGQTQRAADTLLRFGFGKQAGSGFPGVGLGRWAGLRHLVDHLLDDLDREHATLRRRVLVELEALEREEGLTVQPADWSGPGWTGLG